MPSIRYTLDGSEPTATHGHLYTGPFTIEESATLKAITFGDDLEDSEVVEAVFEIVEVEQEEQEESDPDGECVTAVCLSATEAVPTCVTPIAPAIVCLTPAEPIERCGNDEQTCTENCPGGTEGDAISVTVAANTYYSDSIEEANVLALAAACEAAAALRALTPCVETVVSVTQQCQKKEGGCTGFTYTIDGIPFDGIEICGTATGCEDMFGQFAQACGSASVASVDTSGPYPVFSFNNFSWVNTLQTFSLGCGISGTHPAKGPGAISAVDVNLSSSGDISATVNNMTLTSDPAVNPYTMGLAIFYDLVGTEVPAGTVQLDLSGMTQTGCWETVEEDGEIEWESASCLNDVAVLEQDGDDFNYLFKRIRFVLGETGALTIGENYRLTIVFSRRAAGSSDPFVVIEADEVIEFEAEVELEITDWISVPNELGFETDVDSYVLEVI